MNDNDDHITEDQNNQPDNSKHKFNKLIIISIVFFVLTLVCFIFALVPFAYIGTAFFIGICCLITSIVLLFIWLFKYIIGASLRGLIISCIGLFLDLLTIPLMFLNIVTYLIVPFLCPSFGIILGILGLVESRGKSKAGFVISIIAIVLPVIFLITAIILFGSGVAVIALM